MATDIWEKTHYKAKVSYLIGANIREYDITKANISVLRDANAITEDQYQYFLMAPKYVREVSIGKMRGSNPELTKILNAGIQNARKQFIEQNQLQEHEILRIDNDSITVIGNRPILHTAITDRVHFRLDDEFTSYYRIGFLDFLYYYNMISKTENLVVKGLGEEGYNLHKQYMLDLLSEIFYTAQVEGIQSVISFIAGVYIPYVNLQMPLEYYRELNPSSRFRLKGLSEYSTFYMDYLTNRELPILDISHNGEVLRHLYKIYTSIYFRK